jgi:hypothetical protein
MNPGNMYLVRYDLSFPERPRFRPGNINFIVKTSKMREHALLHMPCPGYGNHRPKGPIGSDGSKTDFDQSFGGGFSGILCLFQPNDPGCAVR